MSDPDIPTIAVALARVMSDIGGVAKDDENKQQNYRFRGVDAVVNAVGPALRKHGVIMVPHAGIPIENSYTTKNGTVMTRVVLPVNFSFHGPAGDVIDCQVYGESSDAGDKVLSKAHSVAWRVAMLQVFAIPTDDPDPDEQSHERAADPPPVDWDALGWADQDAHDGAWEQCKAIARRLPEPHHTNVRDWVKSEDGPPYTRAFLDEWADQMDALVGGADEFDVGDSTPGALPIDPEPSRPTEDVPVSETLL